MRRKNSSGLLEGDCMWPGGHHLNRTGVFYLLLSYFGV